MKLELHHINFVTSNVDRLDRFYRNILQMDSIPVQRFPRTQASGDTGYDGKISFITDGNLELHLAEQNFDVAANNQRHINPVERGHVAFRTDDIEAFKKLLDENDIKYADYGTAFAREWHQLFFHDPAGNIIEVHQVLASDDDSGDDV
ncbi:MAG: VOC family protein [Rhizobiaceae bacterium]